MYAFPLPRPQDHKPNRPDEMERIKLAGGMVIHKRVMGELAVSRAFGDRAFKMGIKVRRGSEAIVCSCFNCLACKWKWLTHTAVCEDEEDYVALKHWLIELALGLGCVTFVASHIFEKVVDAHY